MFYMPTIKIIFVRIEPMDLLALSAEFVKKLNAFLRTVDSNDKNILVEINNLIKRITTLQYRLSGADADIMTMISKAECQNKPKLDIYYVRKDGALKMVISKNIPKPVVDSVEKNNFECNCKFNEFLFFNELQGYILIESESSLREVDSNLYQICLQVFDHNYRSFEGFTCSIAFYTPDGRLYIIDALKFRSIIPQLRLLGCGVQKMIHCRSCVERLKMILEAFVVTETMI